jgi:hypothetical protein
LRMERRNPALHAWRRLALKINRVMSSWEMRDLALAITGQLARGRLEGAAQNTLWRCLVRFACEGCCTTTHGLVECVDRAHHPVSAAHECAQCGREDRDPQRLPWHLSPAALPKASVGAACPQAGGKSRCPGPPDPDESGTGSLGWRGLRSLARFAVVQVPGPHQRGTAVRYPRVSVGRLGGGAPALPASHPHDPGTQARVCNECEGPGAGGFPDNAGAWFCGAWWREYFRWRHESRLRALLRGLLAQDVGSVWIRISACLNEYRRGEEGMPGAAALSPGSEAYLAGTMTQGIPCGGRRQSAYRIRLVRAFSSTEVKLPHVSTRVHEHTPSSGSFPTWRKRWNGRSTTSPCTRSGRRRGRGIKAVAGRPRYYTTSPGPRGTRGASLPSPWSCYLPRRSTAAPPAAYATSAAVAACASSPARVGAWAAATTGAAAPGTVAIRAANLWSTGGPLAVRMAGTGDATGSDAGPGGAPEPVNPGGGWRGAGGLGLFRSSRCTSRAAPPGGGCLLLARLCAGGPGPQWAGR